MNSADEKEIQEYTKNLGIEYRFGCYSEKNPDACHLLGDFLDAIQKDPEKAMKVYKANCDESGYGRSCFQYGRLLMRDKNFSDEEKMTLTPPYFERGCQNNHAESCVMNGIGMLARAAGNTDTSLYPRVSLLIPSGNQTNCHVFRFIYSRKNGFNVQRSSEIQNIELSESSICHWIAQR
ncbi:cytochrome c oxidase assembly factor 7 homolog [Diaphorina citri]|uniref:Cytochrome c oxidase assembly factor 7 homolog n=1 Tax=Diaphorina citri TaxID=121845 RepID=A0A1S4E8I0_DIACI|nr:cytochrome c oxidase assembly factor 7 homolog [Diaphorina citri]